MIDRPLPAESTLSLAASPLARMDRHIAAWDWSAVSAINQHLCRKGSAQHGFNPETHSLVATDWEVTRACAVTLGDVLDHLRRSQRREPFFFFNETTFTRVGRELGGVVFAALPVRRRREAIAAIIRYIAGVMERPDMEEIVETMWNPVPPDPGDRVRTLRGSLVGTVLGIADDGRVHWLPDCANVRLISMSELLLKVDPARFKRANTAAR